MSVYVWDLNSWRSRFNQCTAHIYLWLNLWVSLIHHIHIWSSCVMLIQLCGYILSLMNDFDSVHIQFHIYYYVTSIQLVYAFDWTSLWGLIHHIYRTIFFFFFFFFLRCLLSSYMYIGSLLFDLDLATCISVITSYGFD